MYSFLKSLIPLLVVCIVNISFSGIAYCKDKRLYDLGRLATTEEVASWHTDVRPDGHGLPTGVGTVSEGGVIYIAKCASCHGLAGEGVAKFPILRGGENSLNSNKPVQTVGNYWPYATTLWDYINRSMPFGNARSLQKSEVFSLTAYILHLNGLLANDASLNQSTLLEFEMPNKDNFYFDDRDEEFNHDQKICMVNCIKKPNIISATNSNK